MAAAAGAPPRRSDNQSRAAAPAGTALNPADGTSYGLSCTEYTGSDSQTGVQCITATSAGSAFPVWAANVYYG